MYGYQKYEPTVWLQGISMKERLKTMSKSLFLGLVDKRHRMAGKVRQFKLEFTEFEETT